MAFFDYGAAAELFPSRQRTRTMGAVTYMRFAAAAEAIRYAVEEIPANSFLGAFLRLQPKYADCMKALNIRCLDSPLQFGTVCLELPRVGSRGIHTSCREPREPNDREQGKTRTSRSGADGRGDRIGSRAAQPELGPRCPSTAHWGQKLHYSEPGTRPLARGGPGDQTFVPSAWCMKDACTVGRSSGKLELVSLMGVLRPGTGKLQSGSAGLDLRKATCGPVPTNHKPYKVADPRHLAGFTRRRRTR
jgi:hypothetical protein